jgi:hypothetical protein
MVLSKGTSKKNNPTKKVHKSNLKNKTVVSRETVISKSTISPKNKISDKNMFDKTMSNKTISNKTISILKIALMLTLIFIVGIILTVIVYNKYNLLKYQEIDMIVRVENGSSSFNTGTDLLDFARIYPGGGVVKRIDIHSLKKSLVHLKVDGAIADFISFSENNFIMEPNEYKQVEVYLNVPKEIPEGNYTGKLKVYIYKK